VFAHLTQLVSDASGWAYAVVALVALLDAILPIVPSETIVITAGVLAADGKLWLPAIVATAAVGAFSGDNVAYLVGRQFGTALVDRLFRSEKARGRIDWAKQQLRERGGELIVIGRFIPGGRTAVTLSAGLLRFAWRRFAAFDGLSAVVWALYAAFLGYFGGRAFEHAVWKGLLLALALGFALGGLVEAVRWMRRRMESGTNTG
jgi:membrane protein DedA with SNARE-associated domain